MLGDPAPADELCDRMVPNPDDAVLLRNAAARLTNIANNMIRLPKTVAGLPPDILPGYVARRLTEAEHALTLVQLRFAFVRQCLAFCPPEAVPPPPAPHPPA